MDGRRPAGFLIATPSSQSFDDPGLFKEINLVNRIRARVDAWRQSDYPGVTGISRRLLEFWHRNELREKRFFFCQLEAIETLIWMTEAPPAERQGIKIPSDGGDFERWCCKMATGTGKTIVMAMIIAWQAINKAVYPQDTRFSKNVIVVAPGLTVKSRLRVLHPTDRNNIYDEYEIVPDSIREKLFRARVVIHNWHTLMPEEDSPRNIVKLGKESDSAFSRRILGHELNNIVVINDEAHHAYRVDRHRTKGISKTELERDRRWMEGLDKIHTARRIIHCFDFSATPFVPSGKSAAEDMLFGWIVSDFSLNDAIESGLTKTPRIAIRDDTKKFSKEYRSRFYHLYKDDEVKPDLNRNARPHEKLPDLVSNAYMLLGRDWTSTKDLWEKNGSPIPPVMITVCNKTSTAARIMYSFEKDRFEIGDLSDPNHLLHIDSTTIKKAEAQESAGTGEAEVLRRKVDTVGKLDEPGGSIRNIVAVQMLSEGWDAHNVTHIMGLRAFSSQLLCEQVIGRGLRRISYEVDKKSGLFLPEYVNVFGVPFTFLPHEEDGNLKPPPPTTIIEPDQGKAEYMISWPNIDRIDVEYSTRLDVDWSKIESTELESTGVGTRVDMAGILEGKAHEGTVFGIDLQELRGEPRLQRIVFVASKDVYSEMSPGWKGTKEILLVQIIKLVEKFINLGKVVVADAKDDAVRAKMTMLLNMQKIVRHVCEHIRARNTTSRMIHLNGTKPIKSTADMRTWHTKKPTEHNTKSHINITPYDSQWELTAIQDLERNPNVLSWVKNDHLGFIIKYLYNGVIHDYWPDFLIRLANNITLVLEIKGLDDDQNRKKRDSLAEWVDAVNEDGNYGTWAWDVAFDPKAVNSMITKHTKTNISSTGHAKCPRCYKTASSRREIEKEFGFCNMGGISRPQSWCEKCRSQKLHSKKRSLSESVKVD